MSQGDNGVATILFTLNQYSQVINGRIILLKSNIHYFQNKCGETQNRTVDTRIFSPLLYQLSYLAML